MIFIKRIRRDEKTPFTERAIKFRSEKSSRTDADVVAPFVAVAADIEKRQTSAGVKIYIVIDRIIDIHADFENRRSFGALLRIVNTHQQTCLPVALGRPVAEIVESFRSDEFGQIVFQSLFVERFFFKLII